MALTIWLRAIIDELAEDAAHMGADVVRVLVFLLLEFGLSWILAIQQLKSIAPLTYPLLKCAIPVTVLIFCLHLVYILALKAWEDIRKRLETGGHDWRTAVGILLFIGVVSGGYIFYIHSSASQSLAAPESKTAAAQELAKLDLTKLDERSAHQQGLRFSATASQIELLFQVPVEKGFSYMAQIDGADAVILGFRAEGLLALRVLASSLQNGRHHLTVYRCKFGDQPSMMQVRDIAFDIKNGN